MRQFLLSKSIWLVSLCLLSLASFPSNTMAQETSPTSAIKLGTASEKVPAGTLLKIKFNNAMDSRITQAGESFTASIEEDFKSGNRIILPAGTIVRGRVDQVKKPALFSRGGSITLNFDHVVVPSGELLPLQLSLSTTQNTIVNQKGALYSDPGIGKKVNKGVQTGVNTFSKITNAGIQSGKEMAGGFGVIVTAPLSVAGGAIAGTAVTTEKAAMALIGRGDSIVIKEGDSVVIDFGGSFNLPAD